MSNKYVEMAKYMYENKLTYEEMAKSYNYSESSIYRCINLSGEFWKSKIGEMLKEKKLIIVLKWLNIC